MSAYDDFKVGLGSFLTGGAVKVMEGINMGSTSAPQYIAMHPLGSVLLIFGGAFVVIGFVQRFTMNPIKEAKESEKEEEVKN